MLNWIKALVCPRTKTQVGLVTTGNEVFHGRIEDKFGPIIREKFARLGSSVMRQILVSDDTPMTVKAIHDLMEGSLLVSGFQRIQVNGLLEIPDVRYLCRLYPRHTIITQHTPQNRYLLAVDAENHALLVDGSGGRGISPSAWNQPATEKAVGFAGGLGPDNLATELQTIRRIARPGWWADMEGNSAWMTGSRSNSRAKW